MQKWNQMAELDPWATWDVLACGYRLEPYSLLREEFTVALIGRVDNRWVERGTSQEFEPVGWVSIPSTAIMETCAINQAEVPGFAKFAEGQQVKMQTRYDGMILVTITKVIGWPSGWWYALDLKDNPGHGNPVIGSNEICYGGDGQVWARPAKESELQALN